MRYDPQLQVHVDNDGLIAKPTIGDKVKTLAKYFAGIAAGAVIGGAAGYVYSEIPIDAYIQTRVPPNPGEPFPPDFVAIQKCLDIAAKYTYTAATLGAAAGATATRLVLDHRLYKKVKRLRDEGHSLKEIIQETGRGSGKIKRVLRRLARKEAHLIGSDATH